ncbi:hypothetical protein DIPPA_05174 [Diplonema papillatum]|nr:hypothetical protein DIPPA_05174 [Diplonema papillatum]
MASHRTKWDSWDHPDACDERRDEPGTRLCKEMAGSRAARKHYMDVIKKVSFAEQKENSRWEKARGREQVRVDTRKREAAKEEEAKRRGVFETHVPKRHTTLLAEGMWVALNLTAASLRPESFAQGPVWMLVGAVLTVFFSICLTASKWSPELSSFLAHPHAFLRPFPATHVALFTANAALAASAVWGLSLGDRSLVHAIILACSVNHALSVMRDAAVNTLQKAAAVTLGNLSS